jgi:hypothetical protein
VLRFLGFSVAQIGEGFNDKGVQSKTGKPRMRPHHRGDLYDARKKVELASVDCFRKAAAMSKSLRGYESGATVLHVLQQDLYVWEATSGTLSRQKIGKRSL